MIPLHDDNRHQMFPWVTVALIIANVAVFLYELTLGPRLPVFFNQYGMVPATVSRQLAAGQYQTVALNFITAGFIHGGWLHLGGNMLYLWVFGDNVEDRMGHGRYLFFYLICGAIALTTHLLLTPLQQTATIGASGAIAGVLGAYLVLFPRARVSTLIPLIIFFPVVELPAAVLLGFWFIAQLANGLSATAASIAWWAHIGGFIGGVLLVGLFRRRPTYYAGYYHY